MRRHAAATCPSTRLSTAPGAGSGVKPPAGAAPAPRRHAVRRATRGGHVPLHPAQHRPRRGQRREAARRRGTGPAAARRQTRDGSHCQPMRLFTFVQMELPWQLGPADGRYLLRRLDGAEEGEPEHVVVLGTVGAARRGVFARRRRRSRAGHTDATPAPVPVARATVIDPISLPSESQARAWLRELDPEREAHAAAAVLNRVLFSQRIAAAAPHLHEVSPSQALVIRAGYGEGEQVADGAWRDARALVLSRRRTLRRSAVLRPQERLALLLSGRERSLLCEELALRARADLDAQRTALAAIGLERAYAAALVELPGERRQDLRGRVHELASLSLGVEEAATAALAADRRSTGSPIAQREIDAALLLHALERLEAALRARTAPGFTVR
jgi:hypothetical protein